MRGREFPPPRLPSQLLVEKNESGNQIQDGGGEVDVGIGLAAVLFTLAHGVHLLSVYIIKDFLSFVKRFLKYFSAIFKNFS